ncbi:PopZ family protein [Pinisolibacter sp.]|uniref:PopZ family protein n=1 Tax=Pinisolibacter sp. TaxID=2172024 RepID=UPI002FDE5460
MAKAQAQEPSMEEILASIRKIIADEETAPKGAAAKAPALDETISEDDLDKLFSSAGDDEEDEEDVLELTEEIGPEDPPLVEGFGEATDVAFEDIAAEAPEVAEAAFEPDPEPTFEMEPEPEPEPVRAPPPRPEPAPVTVRAPAPPPRPEPAFVAEAPEAAPLISQATEGLVSSAFNDLALTVLNRNARTLEDLVQDMLRPMLKAWLDQNLPPMVERLVKAEIERVTRGR